MVVKNIQEEVKIQIGSALLAGQLTIPPDAKGIVLFAHGSGSSRLSPRNQLVARFLNDGQIATLLFDLLTLEEERLDQITGELRFNISFLAERLMQVTEWVAANPETHRFTVGYFGASTGSAAALMAAAELKGIVRAVVSRGGRPDLAGHLLSHVQAPTLLIVGGDDYGVVELNTQAFNLLSCKKKLEIVPKATHLFEESGTLESVGRMATIWFKEYL